MMLRKGSTSGPECDTNILFFDRTTSRPCGIRHFCVGKRHQVNLMESTPKNHKVTLRVLEQGHAICNGYLMWKAGPGLPQGPSKHGLYECGHQVAMWPELSLMSWALTYSLSHKSANPTSTLYKVEEVHLGVSRTSGCK